MFPTSARGASRTLGVAAIALLLFSALHAPAGAQSGLSLSFDTQYYFVQSINDELFVDYESNINLSPPSAELSCTPGAGDFSRGATMVSCTATLDGQTRTGSFYVLVGRNDIFPADTDVLLGPITPDFEQIEPAGFVVYNVEYRTTVEVTARELVMTTTLPAQVRLERLRATDGSTPNCDTSQLPKITCRPTNLIFGQPQAFQMTLQMRPGFVGDLAISWSTGLAREQRDLLAANNTASVTTRVRPSTAPFQVFLPLLQGSGTR